MGFPTLTRMLWYLIVAVGWFLLLVSLWLLVGRGLAQGVALDQGYAPKVLITPRKAV